MTEYLGPVESKMTTDGKGRGLFATRDIKKGEFILVEKPFADSKYAKLDQEELNDFSVMSEVKIRKGNQNIQAIYDLMRKTRLNKRWMAQAMHNFHGGDSDNVEVSDVRFLNDNFASPELFEESGVLH